MRPTDSAMAQTRPGSGERHLPLEGIRVVEQGAFITGPFASMLLADMGADVIKVERPGFAGRDAAEAAVVTG